MTDVEHGVHARAFTIESRRLRFYL